MTGYSHNLANITNQTTEKPDAGLLKESPMIYNCAASTWVISSAGRASPLQGECREFDPLITHQLNHSTDR